MRSLRIGMAQINATVGDLSGNKEKILRYISQARELGVDLVSFPELAVTGYPPEDLLLKPEFIRANLDCLKQIVEACKGITAVVGFVDRKQDIYNAAAIICDGNLAGVYHKMHLPNYSVFDENRYFQAGTDYPVFTLEGTTFGVNICEDIWYPGGPSVIQALAGDAEVIVNISASPYYAGKGRSKERMLATRASDNVAIVAYNNLVGGQDELVFDGHSVIFDQKGDLIAQGKQFEEDFIVADLNLEAVFGQRLHNPRRRQKKLTFEAENRVKRISLPRTEVSEEKPVLPKTEAIIVHRKIPYNSPSPGGRESEGGGNSPSPDLSLQGRGTIQSYTEDYKLQLVEEVYAALLLGTRDYVHKNGFEKVAIGLSGGIDSSLTCVIAVDALGKDNVVGVFMPSEYSSRESLIDATELAANLGIKLITMPITETFQSYLKMLEEEFRGIRHDVAEENLQARIRGNVLMALSNKFGWLVLTTGNKSETSVGYCTLYGDMAGGFAVIKDVPKTLVYELARYRNATGDREVIPQRVLDKEPSAELKPDQKDVDSLPPYAVLDPILLAYVEEDRSLEEIAAMGFDGKVVEQVIEMVDRNEYKRRQAPPGIKITPRAFGKDRRLPITNKFRDF